MYRQILNFLVGDLCDLDLSRCFGDTSPKPDDDDNEGKCSHGSIASRNTANRCSCRIQRESVWTHRRGQRTLSLVIDQRSTRVHSLVLVSSEEQNLYVHPTIDQKESLIAFLGAALIATLIYRKLACRSNDRAYLKAANEFEQLAVQILNKFYQNNPRTCAEAIIRQIPSYGNITWLQLAVAAEAKEFVAQRAVQDVLQNIWYRRMSREQRHPLLGSI